MLHAWSGLAMCDTTQCIHVHLCGVQPKMRAKFKVSFQSGERLDAHHSSAELSDDSEGLLLLLSCARLRADVLHTHNSSGPSKSSPFKAAAR